MSEPAPLQFPTLPGTNFNENMKATAEYASSTIVPSSADFLNAMQQITLGLVALSQQGPQTPSESDMSIDGSKEFDPTVLNDALTDLERINRSPPQTRYTKAHDELFANSEPICSPIQKRLTNGRAESPSKRRRAVSGVIDITPEDAEDQRMLPETLQKLNIRMSNWQNLESVQARRQNTRRERQAQQTRNMYSPTKSNAARPSPSHPQKSSTVKPANESIPKARTPRLQNPIPSLRSPVPTSNRLQPSIDLPSTGNPTTNETKLRTNIQPRSLDPGRQPNAALRDPRKSNPPTSASRQPRPVIQPIPRSRSGCGSSIQAPKPQQPLTTNRRPLSYAPLSSNPKPQPSPHNPSQGPHSGPHTNLYRSRSGTPPVLEPTANNSRPLSSHRVSSRPDSRDTSRNTSRDASRTEPRMVPRYAPRPESRAGPLTATQNVPSTLRPASRSATSASSSPSPNSSFTGTSGNTSINNNRRVPSTRPAVAPTTGRIVRAPPKSVSQRSIADTSIDMYANLPSYARPTQSALRKSKSYQPSEDLSSVLRGQ